MNYSKSGSVAVFTFDNPPVNALTPSMHKEFYLAMKEFVADDDVRCGILTGAGERAFCAGDDIKTPYKAAKDSREELADHLWPHRNEADVPETFAWARDLAAVERYKPIIGAVDGWCLGQGMIYLLHQTDIRIASTRAKFGFPEIAYGMAGAGGNTRLGRLLPPPVAMWMLLTAEPMAAEEALKHNLINEIVEPAKLLWRAQEIAEHIAKHPPEAVRIEMELFYRSLDLSKADALTLTKHMYRMQRLALATEGGESVGSQMLAYSSKNPGTGREDNFSSHKNGRMK
ncbi:enoyl-CoA hydratase/isomerase family protein [Tianweitania sediminis]|uniref:Enoyl-CoA hydratase/isomerase family protein n=1 Tax=Tianweitania sediminis TaxID=1502156 RepID=A0A8J7UL75_9HYPH|nr:enoyl-CoA hydratase/isomerase family protein [Tianweitania sediminis]MBP0439102.1 enoyl-CoA hydratase/isomerase family protein [Tianweitania sediminis]